MTDQQDDYITIFCIAGGTCDYVRFPKGATASDVFVHLKGDVDDRTRYTIRVNGAPVYADYTMVDEDRFLIQERFINYD